MESIDFYREKSSAEEYDADRFGGSFGRFTEDREVAIFWALVDRCRGPILDVAAGTGKLSLPLIRASRQVITTDSSAEMLRIAKRKADAEALYLQPVVCDAQQLSFRDGAFSCVVCSRALMHISDWRKALSELCRVSDGAVIFDFPPLLSLAGIFGSLRTLKDLFGCGIPGHRVFRVRSIVKELQLNGFRVVTIRREYFLPFAFHRLLNRPRVSGTIEKLFASLGLVSVLGAPVIIKAIADDGEAGIPQICQG